MIYICNFHVLNHFLLFYICELHWNQEKTLRRFDEFLDMFNENKYVQDLIGFQNKGFISSIQALPFIKDDVQADVRYETFIQRVVLYLQGNSFFLLIYI